MLPPIDVEKISITLANFIKETVTSRGFQKIIIAVSGGIDSTTSLFLSSKALGAENVLTLQLPYGSSFPDSTTDGRLAIENCRIPEANREIVDIAPTVDLLLQQLGIDRNQEQNQIRIGNILVRLRMTTLFDRAKKHQVLVVGTENKSEHLLGYYTRYGDEASDIEPIRHLYKTQIYELARYLQVPKPILTKAPTAGLWANQTDEGQFGFTYKIADQILFGIYDQKLSNEELIKQGFEKEAVIKVKAWVSQNHFKHEVPFVYKNS